MDRREFMSWAGAAGLGLSLPACGGGGGGGEGAGPAPAPAPAPAPVDGLPAAAWDGLAAQLQGQLLRPGHADYERVRRVANSRYDAVLPQALLRCARVEDVQAGLAFAQRHALPLVPRGGGHSYLGDSTGPGLVLDLGPLNSVRLDGEIATVGAGATLGDVYEALISQGRCISSGSCLSVGIAGITQGGGFSVIDRAHGLGCDALVGARLVSADGQVLDCEAEGPHADLFWALRGGGGGNFGVLSELRFRSHAITPTLRFQASFALDQLPGVLAAWQAWPQSLPDEVWSQLVLQAGGPGVPAGCTLWGVAIGALGQATALAPHWQGLLARTGAVPLGGLAQAQTLQPRNYRELMLGDCATLRPAECHLPSQNPAGQLRRGAMAASSDFFDRPLDAAGIQALAEALRGRAGQGPGAVLLNLMGGAIARVPGDATAFVHRQALFSAQYLAEYPPGTAAASIDEGAAWTHGLRERMRPWSSGRAYQNYLDAAIADAPLAHHGSNLPRLQQVKRRYDPAGFFKPRQGLRP